MAPLIMPNPFRTAAAPACTPAACAGVPYATQYVCPDFWTSADGNAVWNGGTNRWDLYVLSGSDHFWTITATGWESGLRPTSIDFVFNLNENAFWSFDLFDAGGNQIFSSAASIGPGLVTHNEVCSFGGPGALDDIGNGAVGPPVHALKLATFGTLPAELVSICFISCLSRHDNTYWTPNIVTWNGSAWVLPGSADSDLTVLGGWAAGLTPSSIDFTYTMGGGFFTDDHTFRVKDTLGNTIGSTNVLGNGVGTHVVNVPLTFVGNDIGEIEFESYSYNNTTVDEICLNQ